MQSTETPIAKLDPDEVEREARLMLAGLRQVARRQMLKLIAALLALLTGSAVVAFHFGNWPLGLFGVVVSVAAYWKITKGSRRRQMGVSLPTVLRRLGLEQSPDGPGFLRGLPARLFPRDGDPKVLSVFSGSVDGFPVSIAEVEVRDEKSDTGLMMFEGLVLRVWLPAPLPGFLLLEAAYSKAMDKAPAKRWFAGKPPFDIGSLAPFPALPGKLGGLRLWLAPSADPNGQPLDAVLTVLSSPPPALGSAGRIHSATNDKASVFVALRPTDAPGRIDWTSASGPAASLVIHVTYQWLAQPMALARALIAATDQTAAKS